jgi:hypothetical protein
MLQRHWRFSLVRVDFLFSACMRCSIALMGTRDPDRPVAAAKRGAGVCAFNREKATPSTLFIDLPKPRLPVWLQHQKDDDQGPGRITKVSNAAAAGWISWPNASHAANPK